MKKFFRFLMMALMVSMTCSLASCSDDDGDDGDSAYSSIVGAWQQTNQAGTLITLTFNKGKTGTILFVYPDGSGSSTENFEYDYIEEDRYIEILGSQLDGEYIVTVTARTLRLKDYWYGDTYYEFTKK